MNQRLADYAEKCTLGDGKTITHVMMCYETNKCALSGQIQIGLPPPPDFAGRCWLCGGLLEVMPLKQQGV